MDPLAPRLNIPPAGAAGAAAGLGVGTAGGAPAVNWNGVLAVGPGTGSAPGALKRPAPGVAAGVAAGVAKGAPGVVTPPAKFGMVGMAAGAAGVPAVN